MFRSEAGKTHEKKDDNGVAIASEGAQFTIHTVDACKGQIHSICAGASMYEPLAFTSRCMRHPPMRAQAYMKPSQQEATSLISRKPFLAPQLLRT